MQNTKNNSSKPGTSKNKGYSKSGNTQKKSSSGFTGKSGSGSFSKKNASKVSNSNSKGGALRKVPEKKPVIPKLPEGWFLFACRSLTVSDLRNVFPEDRDVDVWIAAGVLEIVLGEKLTMDIEQMEIPQEPDEDAEWYQEQGILSQFYITFDKEGYQQAMADMKLLVKELGVQICADTEDLTPVIE